MWKFLLLVPLIFGSFINPEPDTAPVHDFLDVIDRYSPPNIGEVIDSYNGINVYYNGDQANVIGRSVTHDNYNLGLKYQCVEFVKRFYYIHYGHKMRDSYGHAKDLFDTSLPDLKLNHDLSLIHI